MCASISAAVCSRMISTPSSVKCRPSPARMMRRCETSFEGAKILMTRRRSSRRDLSLRIGFIGMRVRHARPALVCRLIVRRAFERFMALVSLRPGNVDDVAALAVLEDDLVKRQAAFEADPVEEIAQIGFPGFREISGAIH